MPNTSNDSKITINTRDFGELDIFEDSIIYFPDGLYAFDDIFKYTLICPHDDPLAYPMWLQSIDQPGLCFIVFNPNEIIKDYNYTLSAEEKKILKITEDTSIQCFCISVINDNDYSKTTVNLKCPIIVNVEERIALQIILSDAKYDFRYPLFRDKEENVC